MKEVYEVTIPFIRSHVPPKPILTVEMIDMSAKKVRGWLETLTPTFTEADTLQMTQFKIVEDGINLKYRVIRHI